MLDKQEFTRWMTEFFNKKTDELKYSKEMQPKRVEKITLDLSVATTNPREINIPFSTVIVSRIYSTSAPATDKAGTLNILFDQESLGNLKNAVALYPNDTIRCETLISKSFLTWVAQPDTSVDLYFYPDISVIAGTTKTQIVGTVTTKSIAPNMVGNTISNFQNTPGTYTVPTGFYATIQAFSCNTTAGATVQFMVQVTVPLTGMTVKILDITCTSTTFPYVTFNLDVPAGCTITLQGATNGISILYFVIRPVI